jgi:hypothetical protein
LLINENQDLSRIPEILDRLGCEIVAIRARRSGETFVEVRVLLKGDALVAFKATEVPKDFLYTCLFAKYLC